MSIYSRQQGFTLIELLVVIAIIGVLASVVLASVTQAKIRAENTATLEQVRQVQLALELYYQDHGNYPDTSNIDYGFTSNGVSTQGIVCATKAGCVFDGVTINHTLSSYLTAYNLDLKMAQGEPAQSLASSFFEWIVPTVYGQSSNSLTTSNSPVFYQCSSSPCVSGNTKVHYAKKTTANSAPLLYSRFVDSSSDVPASSNQSSGSSSDSGNSSDSGMTGDSSDNLGGGDSGSSDSGGSDSGNSSDTGSGSDSGSSSDSGSYSDSGSGSDSGGSSDMGSGEYISS